MRRAELQLRPEPVQREPRRPGVQLGGRELQRGVLELLEGDDLRGDLAASCTDVDPHLYRQLRGHLRCPQLQLRPEPLRGQPGRTAVLDRRGDVQCRLGAVLRRAPLPVVVSGLAPGKREGMELARLVDHDDAKVACGSGCAASASTLPRWTFGVPRAGDGSLAIICDAPTLLQDYLASSGGACLTPVERAGPRTGPSVSHDG